MQPCSPIKVGLSPDLLSCGTMYLKILGHPVFPNLNFHMPMIVDLSHPLIMLRGENGCGKSTLLHSIYYALRGEQVEGYLYRLEPGDVKIESTFLFDAEQHNPRQQLEFFSDQPQMLEFLKTASHGHVMLALFTESFPRLPDGSILLLDEPEMALSVSNQRRILKMLMELVTRSTSGLFAPRIRRCWSTRPKPMSSIWTNTSTAT